MRKHSFLRVLTLAALLAAPLVPAAMADQPEQQAMCQNPVTDPAPGYFNPYDRPSPAVGD